MHTERNGINGAPGPLSAGSLIPELQTLRAVGCLLVFVSHSAVIFYPWKFAIDPGRSHLEYLARSVAGFFILSGLVLTLPFVTGEQGFRSKRFYFDRFLRLYPVYWASVLSGLLLRYAVTHWVGVAGGTAWPRTFWSEPLTPRILLEHLLALSYSARPINPALWTQSLEVQACLLFPLVVLMVRRTGHWVLVPIAALTVLFHYLPTFPIIRVMSYFLMGAYVAKYNRSLKLFLQRLPKGIALCGFILLLGFFWIAPGSTFLFRGSFLVFDGCLALLMVGVQAFPPLAAPSRFRPVQKLGELSYCFYLFHLPILTACAFALQPQIHSPILTATAALSLSLLVAWLAHRFLEMPIRSWTKSKETRRSVEQFGKLAVREQSAAS